MLHHRPVSVPIGDRECCMLPPVDQESQPCCASNSTNPNPRSSNAWRRKRTASKSEPKLCRRVRSANSYAARLGNSRPLCTSVSGYRLPDSSHRGRGSVMPEAIQSTPDRRICSTAELTKVAPKPLAPRPLVSARTRTRLPSPDCLLAAIAVQERGLAGGPRRSSSESSH